MVPIYHFPKYIRKLLYIGLIVYQYTYAFLIPIFKRKNSPLVFCIGDAKTGTTSLSKALGMLGYRSVHFPRAGLPPKEGWLEYIKKSNFDAFANWHIMERDLYQEIDKEFPNCKFILTVREPQSYGKSFSRYFKLQNPQQLNQLIQQFENRNQEVMYYFKDSPSRLLVINIIDGDNWRELCTFLNKSIPDKRFPHENRWKHKIRVKKATGQN